MEEWRTIEGTDGRYLISNHGRVGLVESRNDKKIFISKILTQSKSRDGYMFVAIRMEDGKYKRSSVHRLVAKAFLTTEEKEQVNHVDGNKENNHVSNLEWTTRQENITHAWENKLAVKTTGEASSSAKLMLSDIHRIRERYVAGESTPKIAIDFNVDRKTISNICNGKYWGHIEYLLEECRERLAKKKSK